VDEEVRTIIQEAFDKAYNILLQNKTRLIMISERLIKEETLEGPLFESLFNQPLNDEQLEGPSVLAGMPEIDPEDQIEPKGLPLPGTSYSASSQIHLPYNGETSAQT